MLMNRSWRRLSVALALWLIATFILFQATMHLPIYGSGLFYALCASCGAFGFIIWREDRVAALMMILLLPVGSHFLVGLLRLSTIGL